MRRRFQALFLGQVLGQHAAAFAIGAGAVDRAHRARESLDMVEILARIGTQRVEAEPPLGPGLIERMLQHRAFGNFAVDCGGNGHCGPLVVEAAE